MVNHGLEDKWSSFFLMKYIKKDVYSVFEILCTGSLKTRKLKKVKLNLKVLMYFPRQYKQYIIEENLLQCRGFDRAESPHAVFFWGAQKCSMYGHCRVLCFPFIYLIIGVGGFELRA
jgi:hypothetical protein